MSPIDGEKETRFHVFLGAYVHSISKEDPLVIVPNGVIGVKHGKVWHIIGKALLQVFIFTDMT